ncbi:MAG: alpha/beta fold hydrolase [Roseiflexaceae bacterium]
MPTPPFYRSQAGYKAVMERYDAAVAAGPVPYESHMVATRHGDTHVLVGGPAKAPPLVLFHGWNGSASSIGADFPFLFEGYRVYMPDIIGHCGRSAPTRLETAGPGYAEWGGDVLDALGLTQVVMVGISGGGWMTLKIAAHHPARVSRAVAISTDGLALAQMGSIMAGAMPAAIWPNKSTVRRFYRFITSQQAAYNVKAAERFCDDMLLLLKHYKTQSNPGMISDEELGRISSPTLVLMGEDERMFPPQASLLRAHARIPGLVAADLVPAAGHLMTADQPVLLRQKVLAFLKG